jgi:hypothetical protein
MTISRPLLFLSVKLPPTIISWPSQTVSWMLKLNWNNPSSDHCFGFRYSRINYTDLHLHFHRVLRFFERVESLTYSLVRSGSGRTSVPSSWSICISASFIVITDFSLMSIRVSLDRTVIMSSWIRVYTFMRMHVMPCKVSCSMRNEAGQDGSFLWPCGK